MFKCYIYLYIVYGIGYVTFIWLKLYKLFFNFADDVYITDVILLTMYTSQMYICGLKVQLPST